MPWTIPQFSRNQVNRAGAILIDPEASVADREWAFAVINNWRSSHHFPLNAFQNTLRNKAKNIYKDSLIAQRIKRLSSIAQKLRDNPTMKLSQMQDIGGCRAVVGSVTSVDKLVDVYKTSGLKHELAEEYDYIRNPKPSGYRSFHLVYRYNSHRKDIYNRLKIEVQLRSLLQHAWATAVEVVDTITDQALKSSRGKRDWLRFFSLMGTAIALLERAPPVPDTPTEDVELRKQLVGLANDLQVESRLDTYTAVFDPPSQVMGEIKAKHHKYFLLDLDLKTKRIRFWSYPARELERASSDYLDAERDAAGSADIVLVSVDSLAALRRAYPNYFLDTHLFIQEVQKAIAG